MSIERFEIRLDEEVLADLRARIRNTRWPEPAPGPAWDQGADLAYLKRLLAYWADEFDWREHERKLNAFDHFRADLDGLRIHFVHQRARSGEGIPLILSHGWPSTFVEYLPLARHLSDPEAHGIDGPGFDVIVPSLPGYGFSERPATGVNYRHTADLWRRLMRELGYDRYGAHGGDFGAGVATLMALDQPESMLGVHLTNLEFWPYTGPGSRPLSEAENAYVAQSESWDERERGYSSIQSTKPQTVGYGLNDSPAGLAAWILEKWRSWTDSGGDLDRHIPRDFLLTMLTIFWATQTITSSMRDYFDNRWTGVTLGPDDVVTVPTAVALFDNQFVDEGDPPREWAQRLYNIQRWTPMSRGGHFAPIEETELVARDIAAFFTPQA